jgi:hypothetical protein
MHATDIDPHVYSVICDVYDQVSKRKPVANHPLPVRSPDARHFAFELLMRLSELGYRITDSVDDAAEDFR